MIACAINFLSGSLARPRSAKATRTVRSSATVIKPVSNKRSNVALRQSPFAGSARPRASRLQGMMWLATRHSAIETPVMQHRHSKLLRTASRKNAWCSRCFAGRVVSEGPLGRVETRVRARFTRDCRSVWASTTEPPQSPWNSSHTSRSKRPT